MKRIVIGTLILILLGACYRKQPETVATASFPSQIVLPDHQAEERIEETVSDTAPVPRSEDGSFDDFVYLFASDERLQRKRIRFPLPFYSTDTVIRIKPEEWEHDFLFTLDHYYTLLFDNEEDIYLLNNDSISSVQVEWYYMLERKVKRYYFEKVNNAWLLEAINMRNVEETGREDFGHFFVQFATDSLFQREHICDPLEFVTADPDDDFSILEATIDKDQWFAFKPELPKERLSNINYGQQNQDNARSKVVVLKGIGNGFSNSLYFQRRNGKWELYKFEDVSN